MAAVQPAGRHFAARAPRALEDHRSSPRPRACGTIASVVMRSSHFVADVGHVLRHAELAALDRGGGIEADASARPCGPRPALLSVTSSTTGLVMPRIVRSPVTLSLLPRRRSTLVLLNVAVGYFAASKKSALCRCSSSVRHQRVEARHRQRDVRRWRLRPLSASYTSVPSTLPKLRDRVGETEVVPARETWVWLGSSL